MKKIILALALLAAAPQVQAKGGDSEYKVVVVKNEATGNVCYEQVTMVEGVAKQEMFNRAKKWIIANLKTNDNNIAFDETASSISNTATVVLKPASGFNWAITSGMINFKLNMQFKEGRYKFAFDNIVVQVAYADGIVETLNYDQIQRNNKPAKHIKKEVNEKLLAIAMQLETAIKQGNTGNDNW
ncbi:hypothetical protein DBR32_04590 [Taibaiella sp. KBW10]|uniref:DUF4468 domain-containing protein n=1 Tax=Taibaiella sp. KBW10 TaxID=2153357 RepID=UPI000F5A23D6|nr:DUF4468 domain-containing protein [Taibaiella sp. KBW10]RQO31252.1 hypothetical protein DBR32_04590 [Taibaiella sp. KBW10]